MTALVGIYCRDGVVIGADSAATSSAAGGMRTIEQPVMKIEIVDERLIIAGTGQIGLGQRFSARTKDLWQAKKFSGLDPIPSANMMAANAIQDFTSTNAPRGQYGALVAFPSKGDRHLVEFAIDDFQPEFKNANLWYVSMGSGQTIIDPLLGLMREVFWSDGPPSIQDAIFATTWMLDHAVAVNPGGVNAPVRLAILEKSRDEWKARLLTEDELLEHRDNVGAAKGALRNYKSHMAHSEGAVELPPVPATAG
ncbi:hypothetical protein [Dyella telluris]|uniref:Proteasome subunit beta n=1 Tax=Dyella telluris TaxID=2763498 RepID=A0A7G8Q9M9_9GAMM|nr:hypothetical protein [Dyella telluris]QNK03487.1 hypothetical protein H8F01_10430 [Dyella telluris]